MCEKSNYIFDFHIHCSMHRNSMLIRSNKMQQYAGIYLLTEAAFTVFCTPDDGCNGHPEHVE